MNINQLGFFFESYPSLLFVPVGRKHSGVRSLGHKEERAVLSRLHQMISREIKNLSSEEQQLLKRFIGTEELALPVPVYNQENLYANLIRPEMFLWKKHSLQRGLPMKDAYFYETAYSKLSSDQLDTHVKRLVQDYVFCSKLNQNDRNSWLEKIENAYRKHPFIRLAQEKQHVVQAIEIMNRSSLLAVLKYPEDIAYWRHRVEIVMRPYRQIPSDWRWESCEHEKEITIQVESQSILCTCPNCNFTVSYLVNQKCVVLPIEVNMAQAIKRIATIESQFDEIAVQSMNVVQSLNDLQLLKERMSPYSSVMKEVLALQDKLGVDMETANSVACYKALEKIVLPSGDITPDLLCFSKVEVPEIAVLNEVRKWEQLDSAALEEELVYLRSYLEEQAAELKPKPGDVVFKTNGYQITRAEVEKMKTFLQETELQISNHILVQVLKGEATNKVRSLDLHQAAIFGMLEHWPVKFITKSVKGLF